MQLLSEEEFERLLRELKCPFCKKQFKSLPTLVRHAQIVHPLEECPACGSKLKNYSMHFAKREDRIHGLLWILYGGYGRKCKTKRSERLNSLMMEILS